ncbi:integrase [Bradyrhizobium japonicum]
MLSQYLAKYVDQQQSLGFKFRVQQILLRGYVSFAEEHVDRHIRSVRLLTVRRFALAMHAENPRHQVPAADALGHAVVKRRPPYIYSADEIARLLRAAAALRPVGSIRPTMYVTLFGLLTATGMRIAEALALRIDDVTADGFVVRQTKFQKSRLLPLHATARLALGRYLVTRRSLTTTDRALFVSVAGRSLPYNTVRRIFLQLLDSTNLRGAYAGRDPRIHDLRHTFAPARWSSAATIVLRSPATSWRSAPTSATPT